MHTPVEVERNGIWADARGHNAPEFIVVDEARAVPEENDYD